MNNGLTEEIKNAYKAIEVVLEAQFSCNRLEDLGNIKKAHIAARAAEERAHQIIDKKIEDIRHVTGLWQEANKEISRLKKEIELRKHAVDKWVPCPDHRDKTKDQCYVCENERLRKRVEELEKCRHRYISENKCISCGWEGAFK